MEKLSSTVLRIKQYGLTIPCEQLATLQRALEQAAQAGQSPNPLVPGRTLKEMLLLTWGIDIWMHKEGQALTRLHIPPMTSLQTLDTLLSLLAPFVDLRYPAYLEVLLEAEEGDREFFYTFRDGTVHKEEAVVQYFPIELEIAPFRKNFAGKLNDEQ